MPANSDGLPLRTYLVLYNAISALGWLYILVGVVAHLAGLTDLSRLPPVTTTAKSTFLRFLASRPLFRSLFPSLVHSRLPPAVLLILDRARSSFVAIGWQTALVQSCAALEVFHALFAWVRSPLITTLIQVASRFIVIWAIADRYESARLSPFYASMVLSWSITESIRYSFYALNRFGYQPKWLLWLRYNTFYLLYPTGAGSEAAVIFSTLPLYSSSVWTLPDYSRGLLFLIWWPGLYVMYIHMIKQRKKIFGHGQRVGRLDKFKTRLNNKKVV